MAKRWVQDEERIHADAVEWLAAHRGFEMAFEDPDEATGARLDLIGTIAGQPCFAEVKVECVPSTVPQLERKFASALHGHGDPAASHPMLEAMRSVWDGRSPPLIAVIASRYSAEGLSRLLQMMEQRSAQWHVDYEVWEWRDGALQTIAQRLSPDRGRAVETRVDAIAAPRSNRKTPPTLDELARFADSRGIGELYRNAVACALDQGLKPARRNASLTLTNRTNGEQLSLRPDCSDALSGLVVDCSDLVYAGLSDIEFIDLGKGRFTLSRIALADPRAVRRLIEVAASLTNSSP